jgi:hypothetical protein
MAVHRWPTLPKLAACCATHREPMVQKSLISGEASYRTMGELPTDAIKFRAYNLEILLIQARFPNIERHYEGQPPVIAPAISVSALKASSSALGL